MLPLESSCWFFAVSCACSSPTVLLKSCTSSVTYLISSRARDAVTAISDCSLRMWLSFSSILSFAFCFALSICHWQARSDLQIVAVRLSCIGSGALMEMAASEVAFDAPIFTRQAEGVFLTEDALLIRMSSSLALWMLLSFCCNWSAHSSSSWLTDLVSSKTCCSKLLTLSSATTAASLIFCISKFFDSIFDDILVCASREFKASCCSPFLSLCTSVVDTSMASTLHRSSFVIVNTFSFICAFASS